MTRDRRPPVAREILVADEDGPHRRALASGLKARGWLVTAVDAAREALAECERLRPEYAILAQRFSDGCGIRLVANLRARHPSVTAVVVTGFPSVIGAVRAIQAGARDYLPKPVSAEQVIAALTAEDPPTTSVPARQHPLTLDELEWEFICGTLAECRGSIRDAGRRLRVDGRHLRRRLASGQPRRG